MGTDFFERRYRDGDTPWDDGAANDLLVAWLGDRPGEGRAIVVGCGLGDDAALLAARGHPTTAFDAAPTAIARARERHPGVAVTWAVADLLALPAAWERAFTLVVEAYTVQSLAPEHHPAATAAIAGLVAPGGTLLVLASVDGTRPGPGPPWPLTRAEVDAFATGGLEAVAVETVEGGAQWRAELRRG